MYVPNYNDAVNGVLKNTPLGLELGKCIGRPRPTLGREEHKVPWKLPHLAHGSQACAFDLSIFDQGLRLSLCHSQE